MNAPTTTHDVFVSYHSGDGKWVDALVADLKGRDISVWLDRDQIRPGDLFIKTLEDALAAVRCVVVIISPGSLQSTWVQEEFHRALTLINTRGGDRRLIPVLIDDAEPPGFLANRSWVDFRDRAKRPESLDNLIFGITGKKAGGARGDSTSDYIRRDTPGDAESNGIDEVEFLSRQIERTSADARKLRRMRLLAWTPGIAVFAGFVALAQNPPPLVLAAVFVGAPLMTEAIAWGVTATPLALSERKLKGFHALRDGLEMCRARSGPGCTDLRDKFWEMVQSQVGDPVILSRAEM